MQDDRDRTKVLIVGAGMAGLMAATTLQARGHAVQVIDKGRVVGGRLASRRIGTATFDHGAQFVTARDPRFVAAVAQWRAAGVVAEWYRSSSEGPGGPPRWRGRPCMRAIARHLAGTVDLHLEHQLVALRREPEGWIADLANAKTISARAVVLTPPVPQALALLEAGGIELPATTHAHLTSIEYERCLAVMAVLAGPSHIPSPGGLALAVGPIAWMVDNQRKGISATPAVTLHASAAFSLERWAEDRQASGRELLEAAATWLGSEVTAFQVHGWRYSKPLRVQEEPCLILSRSPPLILAGDAFGGPRVEGAALSGWAAADALTTLEIDSCTSAKSSDR